MTTKSLIAACAVLAASLAATVPADAASMMHRHHMMERHMMHHHHMMGRHHMMHPHHMMRHHRMMRPM